MADSERPVALLASSKEGYSCIVPSLKVTLTAVFKF